MDFQDILAHASHNAEKANKVIQNCERETLEQRQRKQAQYERELIREREEKKRKAPPKVEKKFVIPKRTRSREKTVNPAGVQNFMERQRQAEVEKEMQRRAERDKLIELRLQANQGKANKKIAAQFGKTALELQKQYAPNSCVETELLKRQQREQEEITRSSNAIRESIIKAKNNRASTLSRVRPAADRATERVRVGSVKAGGFTDITSKQEAILTKRRAENLATCIPDRVKQTKRPKVAPSSGHQSMDFKALMEAARQNSDVKRVAAKSDQIMRQAQQTNNIPVNSRKAMKRTTTDQRNRAATPKKSSSFSSPSLSDRNGVPGSSSNLKRHPKHNNPHALSDRQVLGSPAVSSARQIPRKAQVKSKFDDRPMPLIPQLPSSGGVHKESRILPGDIRYNGPLPPSNASNNFKKPSLPPSSSKPRDSKEKRPKPSDDLFSTPNTSSRSTKHPASPAQQHHDLFGISPSRRPYSSQVKKPDKHSAKPRSNPAMFNRRGGASSSSFMNGYNYSDEDLDDYEGEDDEYDSEMDDFIDDSEVQELESADFEESLRFVNRNYDKNKWRMREKMIDMRHMDANYQDIEKEEKRSSRLALMEDFLEAKRGSKGLT